MEAFRSILIQGAPVLMDGATGTELYQRGVFINRSFDDVNLTSPELVAELHREYVKAGAKIITTNSWSANRFKLTAHNLADKLVPINQKAVELARKASEDKAWVAGSIGPLGVRIEPFGATSYKETRQAFQEQAEILLTHGVDLINLETFSDVTELEQAILAIRDLSKDIPLIAHMILGMGGKTPLGVTLRKVIKKFNEWDIDACGFNCSVGPQPMMSWLEKTKGLIKKPISVQPNAGLPREVEGRQIYMSTPEYMAHFAKIFWEMGVQFVGGCCGTSPSHIKAMANAHRYAYAVETKKPQISLPTCSLEEQEKLPQRVCFEKKSKWSEKIAHRERVSSVELLPPPGIDPSQILAKARTLKENGVHAINIPDGPRASARMSAILTAVMIEKEVGIETVLHYTCRDRNLLGMQSDMLGAQAIGLRNILAITGDPPKLGNYPNATGVFDVDAIGLTNMLHQLNGGLDLGGRSIGQQVPSISIGVGVNPVHRDFEYEMRRFAWKVQAGAEWAITQPVFSVDAIYRFFEHMDKNNIRIPIIAGIWPLTSYRNALFMNNEVPGVYIPDTILNRMEKIQDPEDAKKLGVDIAIEMVERLGNLIHGIQVSAPFGRVDLALRVIGLNNN